MLLALFRGGPIRTERTRRAEEVLSLFTKCRQQWYEEERELIVMREEQAREENKLLKIKQDRIGSV
ncbi:hypothetical protein ANCCAN_15457 [Ancylostoma caninum]|uniref:Uncharacterized protein n=1 Tax=Ancylostoma caninum TaxID=29170 RepID=A0A368G6F2_ANCCA|nr:hypothetical protein ANCCAN_15457 [Ancylostoma caninum]